MDLKSLTSPDEVSISAKDLLFKKLTRLCWSLDHSVERTQIFLLSQAGELTRQRETVGGPCNTLTIS